MGSHKIYQRLKLKIFLILTLNYIGIALVSGIILHFALKDSYLVWYPVVGAFYWLMGIGMNYFLDQSRMNNPDKIANVFMMTRASKLLFTVIFLILYSLISPETAPTFALIVVANYILCGMFEVYVFYLYNKRIKKKQ